MTRHIPTDNLAARILRGRDDKSSEGIFTSGASYDRLRFFSAI
jgi:hypothetical protein